MTNLRAVNAPLANELDTLLAAGDYIGLEAAVKATGNFEMAEHIDLMLNALAAKSKKGAGVINTTNAKDKGAGNDPDMDDDTHDEDQAAPDANAQPHKIASPKKKGGTTGMAKSMMATMAKTFADAAGMEVVPAGTTEMLEKFQQAAEAAAKSIAAGAGGDDAPVNSAQAHLDEMISMASQSPKTDKVVGDGKAPDVAQGADILRGTPFTGSADAMTILSGTPFAGSVDTAGIVSGTPAQKSARR